MNFVDPFGLTRIGSNGEVIEEETVVADDPGETDEVEKAKRQAGFVLRMMSARSSSGRLELLAKSCGVFGSSGPSRSIGPEEFPLYDWESLGVNSLHGAEAWADGLLPVWDPFASAGAYDPNGLGLNISQAAGQVSQVALGEVAALRGAAWFGGTRLGHFLNHNRFLRIGPGRMPRNGRLPAGSAVPRVSIGPQRPGVSNPHFDLRFGLWK